MSTEPPPDLAYVVPDRPRAAMSPPPRVRCAGVVAETSTWYVTAHLSAPEPHPELFSSNWPSCTGCSVRGLPSLYWYFSTTLTLSPVVGTASMDPAQSSTRSAVILPVTSYDCRAPVMGKRSSSAALRTYPQDRISGRPPPLQAPL